MYGLLVLLIVLIVIALIALPAVILRRTRSERVIVEASASPALGSAERHTRRTQAIAVVLGLVAGLVAARVPWPSRDSSYSVTLLVAPGVFGVVSLAALALGERTSPIITTELRGASLHRRRGVDYLSTPVTIVTAALIADLLATIVVGLVVADPGGRSISWTRSTAQGVVTSSIGPWPGWFYALPAVLVLLAELVLAGIALRAVASRTQLSSAADAGIDDLLRRRSAESVLGMLLVSLAVLTCGLGTVMARLGLQPGPSWFGAVAAFGLTATLLGLLGLGYGVALLIQRPAAVSPAPAAPAAPERTTAQLAPHAWDARVTDPPSAGHPAALETD